MATAASSIRPTAAVAAFSYLFIEHEPRGKRSEHDKEYVEVDEQPDRLIGAPTAPHRNLNRLAARDDEGHEQRQRQEWKQQLSSADAGDHRGEQAANRSHADRGQQHCENKSRR